MARAEIVDLVDLNDRVTGRARLQTVLKNGLLHRAVAVAVFVDSERIILQRRSLEDSWRPGFWTLSCTGHVRSGEDYADAARRELSEELGLDSPVSEVRKLLLPPIHGAGVTEHEFVTLFTSVCRDKLEPDSAEVEELAVVRLGGSVLKRYRLTEDARILLRLLIQ